MHDGASVLTDSFPEVLARLPADVNLDRLALQTRAIQRQREVVDGAALLRIALARGPGAKSLPYTAAWASMLRIADLSNPGVKWRLDQATEYLAALAKRLLPANVPGAELRWPAAACTSPTAAASANPAAPASIGAATARSTLAAAASRTSNSPTSMAPKRSTVAPRIRVKSASAIATTPACQCCGASPHRAARPPTSSCSWAGTRCN